MRYLCGPLLGFCLLVIVNDKSLNLENTTFTALFVLLLIYVKIIKKTFFQAIDLFFLPELNFRLSLKSDEGTILYLYSIVAAIVIPK